MEKQLKLRLLPNNQISVITQLVNKESDRGYSGCPDYSKQPEWRKEYYRNGQARFDRERAKTHETKRVPFYKLDGSVAFRLLRVEIPKRDRENTAIVLGDTIPTLDIIQKSQRYPSSCRGYGMRNRPKKYTNRSGQKVRETGAMLDMCCYHDVSQVSCTTLTLPANTPESFDVIARYSGYVINRLFQIIRRNNPVDPKWFFVWEYQKRGALHLHIAHFADDPTDSQYVGTQLIEKWHDILVDVSEFSQCCLFTAKEKDRCTVRSKHQHHTQPMYSSVGAYFSKYASKNENSKEGSYISKFAQLYPVSRFWGSSKALKELCKKYTYEEIIAINEGIEEAHQDIIEFLLLNNPVKYNEYEWKKEMTNSFGWNVTITEGIGQVFYFAKEVFFELFGLLAKASRKYS
jgi:hypothetical protein